MAEVQDQARQSLRSLRQRRRAGTLSPVISAVMDEVDPNWALPESERHWRQMAAAWGLHLRRTGARPRLGGARAEAKLARWEARQRDAHASGRLAAHRVQLMLLIERRELRGDNRQ